LWWIKYYSYKITAISDGLYLRLFNISPANVHDLAILKENSNEFIREYISKEFTKYLKDNNVYLIPIKRKI